MKKTLLGTFFLIVCLISKLEAQPTLHKMETVNFSQVAIEDNFWKPRILTVSTVTIPVCINQTEVKTARIRNFEKVAAKKGEKHEGIYYDCLLYTSDAADE